VLAIAADTLSVQVQQAMNVNHCHNCKIIDVAGSFLGITGPSSAKLAIAHYFANNPSCADFGSTRSIFETWLLLHDALRSQYFLKGAFHGETSYESSRMDVIIANKTGAYIVSADRSVDEILRYHAIGKGDRYALGAMHALHADERLSAEEVALAGIAAAAEFQVGTALPALVYTIQLADRS
jgi:ATP-dependent protease HslVU (ClpYQ) peptidase subunit